MNETLKRLLAQMQAITERAKAENRGMTAEEKADFDKAKAEFDGIEATIKADESTRAAAQFVTDYRAPQNPGVRAQIGMTDGDIKKYSLSRLLLSQIDHTVDAGFEREVAAEVAKKMGSEARGIFVPYDVLTRDLSVGTATAGGNLVEKDYRPQDFIEMLRNKSLMMGLGVQTLTGLVGDVYIPKQTGSATAYWLNEAEDTTGSDMTVGLVSLTPKTVSGKTATTRKLLLQSNPAIEALMMRDLSTVLGLAIDKALISGAAASKQPVGILNTSGIGSVDCATASGGLNWANVVKFETAIETANYDVSSCGWLTTPAIRGTSKTTLKASNTAVYLNENNEMNGYKVNSTNQVSANTLIFGDFSQIILGMWGALDLMVDPFTKGDSGGVVIRAFQSCDALVRQPAAFAASTNVNQ